MRTYLHKPQSIPHHQIVKENRISLMRKCTQIMANGKSGVEKPRGLRFKPRSHEREGNWVPSG